MWKYLEICGRYGSENIFESSYGDFHKWRYPQNVQSGWFIMDNPTIWWDDLGVFHGCKNPASASRTRFPVDDVLVYILVPHFGADTCQTRYLITETRCQNSSSPGRLFLDRQIHMFRARSAAWNLRSECRSWNKNLPPWNVPGFWIHPWSWSERLAVALGLAEAASDSDGIDWISDITEPIEWLEGYPYFRKPPYDNLVNILIYSNPQNKGFQCFQDIRDYSNFIMWVKQYHKPPMTRNGWNPTYKTFYFLDGLCLFCLDKNIHD